MYIDNMNFHKFLFFPTTQIGCALYIDLYVHNINSCFFEHVIITIKNYICKKPF